MSRLVTVFSASSLLGSAITRSLSQEFSIRAVINDPNSSQIAELKNVGAEVIAASHHDPQAVLAAVTGAWGCFVATETDFSNPNTAANEFLQGKVIAEACARAGVKHVVFNTQLDVVAILGIRCAHMDTKAKINSYMNDLGLPLTSLLLPVLYELLLAAPLKPKADDRGSYALEIPMGDTPLNLISVEDVAEVVREVFARGQHFIGKTLSLSGDKLKIREIADIMTRHISPKQFRDKQVTLKQFCAANFAGAQDLANMFDFYCRVDQRFSVDLTKSIYPGLRRFDEWVKQNAPAIADAIGVPVTPSRNAYLAL